MALNLFKRVDSVKGLFAVESISLIYNALTTIMVLILFPRMDHPVIMLLERAGIVAITFALIYLYRKYPCKLTAFIRMAVQMAFLAYWYPDTFEFNRLFPNLDNFFASAEQFLFRCQPSVEFSEHFPSMWFSEPFNMGYFAYYPMIGIVTIYYFLFRFEWFEKVSFVLVTSFFIYYLIYILVPVAGPQFYFPAIGMDNVMAQHFPAIGDYFNNNDILLPGPGCCHAYRVNKKLCYFLAPFYVLLCCATVYIQAHYLVDVIAGWISAVCIYIVATYMYKRWFASVVFQLVLK